MRINRKYKGGSGIDAVAHRRAINVAQTRAIQSGGESFLPPFTVTKGNTQTASANTEAATANAQEDSWYNDYLAG